MGQSHNNPVHLQQMDIFSALCLKFFLMASSWHTGSLVPLPLVMSQIEGDFLHN